MAGATRQLVGEPARDHTLTAIVVSENRRYPTKLSQGTRYHKVSIGSIVNMIFRCFLQQKEAARALDAVAEKTVLQHHEASGFPPK